MFAGLPHIRRCPHDQEPVAPQGFHAIGVVRTKRVVWRASKSVRSERDVYADHEQDSWSLTRCRRSEGAAPYPASKPQLSLGSTYGTRRAR
jgi:hypothetical protein